MKSFVFISICIALLFGFSSCGKIQSSMDLICADMAYNQGNFSKAIELYQKVIADDPQKAEFYWKLGVAYYSAGDKPNARRQVTKLREFEKEKLASDLEHLIAQ